MIDRICLLLEALSVVICLHHLYGEKFRLDIKTVGFLAVDMIIMEFINHYEMSKSYTMIIYPVIVIYCILRFGFKIRALIINNILYMSIVSGIQVLILIFCFYIFHINHFNECTLLTVNIIAFIIILLLPRKLKEISKYLQDKEKILIVALIVSIVVTLYCLFSYKSTDVVELNKTLLLFVCIIFIVFLVVKLSRYKVKTKEIETEFKMHKLYEGSFEGLIENIRLRQHEFDNHINTIFNQHYMYRTYDELVLAQKEYCDVLLEENRFNKMLSKGNPVIICFLYGKFLEIEKQGIDISYKISINELNVKIPVYKIVEILGDLINNAVEAMEQGDGEKRLHVSIAESDGSVMIEVRNTSRYISHNEISRFFEKGYSKKGTNRGLGLYNVKRICEEYGLKVACENKEIGSLNWLSFRVFNE